MMKPSGSDSELAQPSGSGLQVAQPSGSGLQVTQPPDDKDEDAQPSENQLQVALPGGSEIEVVQPVEVTDGRLANIRKTTVVYWRRIKQNSQVESVCNTTSRCWSRIVEGVKFCLTKLNRFFSNVYDEFDSYMDMQASNMQCKNLVVFLTPNNRIVLQNMLRIRQLARMKEILVLLYPENFQLVNTVTGMQVCLPLKVFRKLQVRKGEIMDYLDAGQTVPIYANKECYVITTRFTEPERSVVQFIRGSDNEYVISLWRGAFVELMDINVNEG